MNIKLGSNLRARVLATEVVDEYSQLKDSFHPFKEFKVGSDIQGTVFGFHDVSLI